MTDEKTLQNYENWKFKLSAYQMALSLIGIDKQTIAPIGGGAYRDERTAFLAGELFTLKTDPKMAALVQQLKDDPTADPTIRREAELYCREAEKTLSIPKEEFVRYEKLTQNAYDAWLKAKNANDYSIFEPFLKDIIASKKHLYTYRRSKAPIYDQMLADHEPGTDCAFYDQFFNALKKQLLPLVQQIAQAEPVDDAFLHCEYPIDQQKKFTQEHLLPLLGFTSDWGYENETEHPFTSWICENDCRTTTKYLLHDIVSPIFSTIHETGHAWYAHNVDPAYDGSILMRGISAGMHESQSRFCENYLGRSRPFWEYLYPQLQASFPTQLGRVSLDRFLRAVNASHPTLVRTQADELTYPFHIIIRYEMEKAIFAENLPMSELKQTWSDLYEKYLGIRPIDDRSGILQDMHWAIDDFGYFPTYALGSAFAAQFYHRMRQQINVDQALSTGHYTECIQWLKENIHRYGCRYDAAEIMQKATGEPFNPDYYIDYLEKKYRALYQL